MRHRGKSPMSQRGRTTSSGTDLIGRISDTIASHTRLSAAAAFQMGVLLGQVMNQTGAMKELRRTVAAAPGAIASSLPSLGLFETKRSRRKTPARRQAASTARSRPTAKKTGRPARATKQRKRASA